MIFVYFKKRKLRLEIKELEENIKCNSWRRPPIINDRDNEYLYKLKEKLNNYGVNNNIV